MKERCSLETLSRFSKLFLHIEPCTWMHARRAAAFECSLASRWGGRGGGLCPIYWKLTFLHFRELICVKRAYGARCARDIRPDIYESMIIYHLSRDNSFSPHSCNLFAVYQIYSGSIKSRTVLSAYLTREKCMNKLIKQNSIKILFAGDTRAIRSLLNANVRKTF